MNFGYKGGDNYGLGTFLLHLSDDDEKVSTKKPPGYYPLKGFTYNFNI